jgi:hypothetical protein
MKKRRVKTIREKIKRQKSKGKSKHPAVLIALVLSTFDFRLLPFAF